MQQFAQAQEAARTWGFFCNIATNLSFRRDDYGSSSDSGSPVLMSRQGVSKFTSKLAVEISGCVPLSS